jgi:SAM-dependent methyltransferase
VERHVSIVGNVRIQFEIAVDPASAFDQVLEDLAAGLRQSDLVLTPGPRGGIESSAARIAEVVFWEGGKRVALAWAPSEPSTTATEIEIQFRSLPTGTEVTLEARNWDAALGPMADISGWVGSQIAAPLIDALSPESVADWVTDRVARCPSGRRARANYRDPRYHYPSFRVILQELELRPSDILLDVGCGGGAFLKESLESGCQVAGVDHSVEMVQVAREVNQTAIADGKAQIVLGRADRLPFEEESFTCASMSGVLGFLLDPTASFAEIRRVLRPGGRFVTLGSDTRLRGTAAAPEPVASRLRFYDDEQLENLGRAAGFDKVVVTRHDLTGHARDAGVPEEHLHLFRGLTSFLVARK